MLLDARSLSSEEVLEADLCIVGAGVAGITLARELKGRPLRVLVLESGGLRPEPETQDLARGEVTGHPYFSLEESRKRAVGGTSWGWWIDLPNGRQGARLRALDAIDFEERPGVPHSGWPITKEDLDPYYEQAHDVFRMGPYTDDPADWEQPGRTSELPLANSDVKTTIFQFVDLRVFADLYPEELKEASNVTLVTHATATELETNESASVVKGLRARTLTGKSLRVESPVFVLAAGGIENARLLLLSNRYQRGGLGNQHDLVGRFFMEHLHARAGWYVPSNPTQCHNLALYLIHEARGMPIMGYLAPTEETLRRERLLNYGFHLNPEPHKYWRRETSEGYQALRQLVNAVRQRTMPERPLRHLKRAAADAPDLARIAFRKVRRQVLESNGTAPPENFTLLQMSEQTPNPESRVLLGSERDALGQPRARLHWKLHPKDVRDIQRAQRIIGRALEQSGLGHIEPASIDTIRERIEGGYHHMGTTRMSSDPRKGVVDADCKVHGVGNLYIAGSSVFPTGGYANPTLTIAALALRLAEHLDRAVLN